MPGKRNDMEENAAEREIAVTRIALAWALVLVILFWITSFPPSTESRSIQFLIRGSLVHGSLGGGDASTESGGECEEGMRMIRASLPMPQVFDVARRMMGKAWADPKPFAMTATFAGEDGKALLSMRMVFVAAEARDENARVYGSIEGGKQTLERLAEHLSARFSAKTNGGVR
jgi:hypothetical protein